jgi:elongation factor Ts
MTPEQIQQLKALRANTGISLDKCRIALENTQYDLEAARAYIIQHLLPHADAKAHRSVGEGVVVVESQDDYTSLVVLKAETDFVALHPSFKAFAHLAATVACQNKIIDLAELIAWPSINTALRQLIMMLGESIQLTSLVTKQGEVIGSYVHANKIGCLVTLVNGDPQIAHELAIHIVAAHPTVIHIADFPQDILAEQLELVRAENLHKPEHILEKILEGKKKLLFEADVLVCQPFFRQSDMTIAEYLHKHHTAVREFVRIELN